jgi:amino acid transporter
MKKLTKYFTAIIIALLGLAFFATPAVFADSSTNSICDNNNVSDEVKAAAGCTNTNSDKFPSVVTSILNGVIGMLGLVAVAFIVVGGVNYMTSTGDPGKTKKAKDTILYACIGLIVCALSFAIVNFTINIINHAGDNTSGSSSEEPAPDKPVKPGEVEQYEK